MRERHPKRIVLPVEFQANKDHVVAVVKGRNGTVGLRFESPEHLLEFFHHLIEKAVQVWPDNEWIKEYLREEGENQP